MASIRAVAARAGVSPATVSRVLNGRGYVSQAVREKVERAVAELNYRPNVHARRLRGIRSHSIGLIFTHVTHPFSAEVAEAIEEVARQHGYFTVVGNTHRDSQLFDQYLAAFLAFGVDGLVVVPPATTTQVAASLAEVPVPWVVIDQPLPGLAADQVLTDNVEGAYRLTTHLLRVGHRRIAFVGGHPKTIKGRERLAGYERALGEYGLPVDRDLVRMRDFDEASGYELATELLQGARPNAFFAANLDVQLGVLRAVRDAGLAVPDDIALAGFDDLPFAAQFAPFLTVVAQQTRTIGVIAAQLLMDKLRGKRAPSEHQTVLLQPQLIVRASCGAGQHFVDPATDDHGSGESLQPSRPARAAEINR